jgi:hypothetical protein
MGSRPECGPYGLARVWRSSDEGHKKQSQQQGSTQTAVEDLENRQLLQPRPLPMKMAAPSQTVGWLLALNLVLNIVVLTLLNSRYGMK